MKAIRLFTLLAACLFDMAALAQQNPPAQPSGDDHHGGRMDMSHDMGVGHDMGSVDDHLKKLTEKLSLTADQQTKVRELLTDEQKTKFDAVVKDMDGRMHGANGMHDKDHDHDKDHK